MNIRGLVLEADLNNHSGLLLLLDFLINEKQVINMSDDTRVLEIYFMPKHKDRLNKLLGEYIEKRRADRDWLCYGLY
jgi:hypothetical protein